MTFSLGRSLHSQLEKSPVKSNWICWGCFVAGIHWTWESHPVEMGKPIHWFRWGLINQWSGSRESLLPGENERSGCCCISEDIKVKPKMRTWHPWRAVCCRRSLKSNITSVSKFVGPLTYTLADSRNSRNLVIFCVKICPFIFFSSFSVLVLSTLFLSWKIILEEKVLKSTGPLEKTGIWVLVVWTLLRLSPRTKNRLS